MSRDVFRITGISERLPVLRKTEEKEDVNGKVGADCKKSRFCRNRT